jgi:hypothetical protein
MPIIEEQIFISLVVLILNNYFYGSFQKTKVKMTLR